MPARPRQSLRGVASALLFGLACAAPALPQETPHPSAQGAVRSPGNADWAPNLEEARQRAAAQKKFLFVEFGSLDCRDCIRMDNLLYRAFDFEALLLPMVPVKLSLNSGEGEALARKHGIREAPAVLVKSPEGRLVVVAEGFSNPQDFYSNIRKELETYNALARRLEAQDVAKLPAGEALETGRELFQRGDASSAIPRLRRAIAAPGAKPSQRDEAQEILAAAELDAGDVKGSRQTINRLIETTKDPDRRERAEIFRAQIPLAENKPEEAYALFQKFEKDHPDSKYVAQVRAIRERLSPGIPKP